jgi:LSD1 subclass zinc finger protein
VAGQQVAACPHCTTPLLLPPGENRALRCSRCGRLFRVRV